MLIRGNNSTAGITLRPNRCTTNNHAYDYNYNYDYDDYHFKFDDPSFKKKKYNLATTTTDEKNPKGGGDPKLFPYGGTGGPTSKSVR